MAEYINKDTIEKFIKDGLNNPDKSKAFGHDAIEILEEIYLSPAADVAEVKHGRWRWEGKFKACSNCGSHVEWNETLGANFWKFCPYCGTKMDGEKENG